MSTITQFKVVVRRSGRASNAPWSLTTYSQMRHEMVAVLILRAHGRLGVINWVSHAPGLDIQVLVLPPRLCEGDLTILFFYFQMHASTQQSNGGAKGKEDPLGKEVWR